MSKIFNSIISNNALFAGVIIILCLLLIILIILIIRSVRNGKKINIYEEDLEDEQIKKVKKVKKEDIIDTPEKIEDDAIEVDYDEYEEDLAKTAELELMTDAEIKERYDEEKEKEIDEIKEENDSEGINDLIDKLEETSNLTPEEVVANFEEEQEAQSIISYKELVDAVKNRSEVEYEDELEKKPLATVSDYVKEDEGETSTESIIEEMNKKIEMTIDDSDIEELLPTEEEEIKLEEKVPKEELPIMEEKPKSKKEFKKTDVISPVYGVVEDKEVTGYANVPKFEEPVDMEDLSLGFEVDDDDEDSAISVLDDIYNHMTDDYKKQNQTDDTAVLDSLVNNQEFLQSLKDFRNKL